MRVGVQVTGKDDLHITKDARRRFNSNSKYFKHIPIECWKEIDKYFFHPYPEVLEIIRPASNKEDAKTKMLSIRVSDDESKMIRDKAKELNVSQSKLIIAAVNSYKVKL